jgi:HEAT repeat protein
MSHLESAPEWIVGLLGEIGPDAGIAIAELSGLLQRHGDVEVQLATVTALWRIENRADRVLPAMLDLLKNNDAEVRCETLQTLGQMRPVAGKALPAILQAFSDTDSSVRSEAISLVTSLALPPRDMVGDKEDIYGFQEFEASLKNLLAKSDVVPRLLLILRDESKVERSEVAKLLALLAPNNPEVLDGLIAALKDRTSTVRASVVISMGKMGVAAKTAVPALTLMLNDRSKHVREAAVKALKQIDELQ